MAVNLTRPVGTVIPDNAPTAKATHRTLFNDIIAAVNGLDPLLTPSYASRAAAEAGAPALVAAIPQILVREGTVLVIRSRTASTDDPLFATGAQWGVVLRLDAAELARTATRLATAVRDAGIIPTANVAGTSNAITADIAPTLVTAGVTTLGTASEIELIPAAANTAANPTITIAGLTIGIRNADGSAWPANGFVVGRCYKLRRTGGTLRVVAGDATVTEISVARQERIATDAQIGTVPLERVAGTGDAITASVPPALIISGLTVANLGCIRWQAIAANTGAVTISVDGQAAVHIRDQNGDVLPANQFMPGRFYEAVRVGTVWRLSTGDVTAGDVKQAVGVERAARETELGAIKSAPSFSLGIPLLTALNGTLIGLRTTGLDFIPSDELVARLGNGGGGGDGVVSPEGTWAGKIEGGITTFTAPAGKGMVDRFYLRNGERRPTADLGNGRKRRARIICHYGASNAGIAGGTELPRVYWNKNDVPHYTLTLNDFGSNRGGLRGFGGGDRLNTATALVEAIEVSQLQSVVAGTSQALVILDGAEMGVNIVRSEAKGGEPLVGTATALWKETLTSPVTQTFTNLHMSIRQMHDLAVAEGYEVPAIYIPFTAGAGGNEGTIAAAEYLARWRGFKADLETCLADLGVPVVWLMDQNGPAAVGSNLAQQIESRIAQVQATFIENDGANVILVQPGYHLAFVWDYAAGTIIDPTHTSNQDRLIRGEGYAHAIKAYEAGRPWQCPIPAFATISGNSVVVDFRSIYPIKLDWDFCMSQPDGGFTFDGTVVATAVRQSGARQITVTCNSSPAGRRMWYAGRPIADESWPCEFSKSRGAVRESWSAASTIVSGRKLYRPAVAWFFDLGA